MPTTYDLLTSSSQLGGDLEVAPLNATKWGTQPHPVKAGLVTIFPGENADNVSMCIKGDELWVAFQEAHDNDFNAGAIYVKRWIIGTSSSWEDMGFADPGTPASVLTRPRIVTDGDLVWVVCGYYRSIGILIPPVYEMGMRFLYYDGSWNFSCDQPVGTGQTVSGGIEIQAAAYGGSVYAQFHVAGSDGGATSGSLVADADASGAGTSMALPNDANAEDVQILADAGGSVYVAHLSTTDPDDLDTGSVLETLSYPSGTQIDAKTAFDLIGTAGVDRPAGVNLGAPADNVWTGTEYLVMCTAATLAQIETDGTIGPIGGEKAYSRVYTNELVHGAKSAAAAAVTFDDLKDHAWVISVFVPATFWVLQPPCTPDPLPLEWMNLTNGDTVQPHDAGSVSSYGITGERHIAYHGDTLYTAYVAGRTTGNPDGTDDSDSFWNGHVQVWQTGICRDCGVCPSGLHAWDRF